MKFITRIRGLSCEFAMLCHKRKLTMYIQEFTNKIVTNNKHNKMVFGGQPYFIILKIHGLLSTYLGFPKALWSPGLRATRLVNVTVSLGTFPALKVKAIFFKSFIDVFKSCDSYWLRRVCYRIDSRFQASWGPCERKRPLPRPHSWRRIVKSFFGLFSSPFCWLLHWYTTIP